ncbi:MAG: class I SAM-dependent methyltransferase [Hyphomicrobiaceae bacterium]
MTASADVRIGSAALGAEDRRSCGPAAYATKDPGYFAGARADFIKLLPDNPNAAILEIGCGTGATGRLALQGGKAGRYVGVELFEAAAAQARRVLSDVIVGDIEKLEVELAPCTFDALILSEVLEHLVDPWTVVRRLAPLIRPGGKVLASSPNVAHRRVVLELLRGRFDLADQGVFDRTHMRWFTPTSYRAMFEAAGIAVTSVGPVTPFSTRTRILSRLTGGRFDHLFMVQIALIGHRR